MTKSEVKNTEPVVENSPTEPADENSLSIEELEAEIATLRETSSELEKLSEENEVLKTKLVTALQDIRELLKTGKTTQVQVVGDAPETGVVINGITNTQGRLDLKTLDWDPNPKKE